MNLQKLLSYTRRAIDSYEMIDNGDKIAVGISGGKDSLTLLYALAELRRFYPKKFDLIAITVNLGFDNFDTTKIEQLCKELYVPYYIVGNGSNLLVGDGGFRGVVLQIFKKMNDVRVEGERVTAQAGVLLSKVASAAYNASLTGLEFAAGIPGTLGGAVRMNAGAYGGEMKQVLESAVVLTQEGKLLTIPVEELGLAYRTSVVEKKDYVVVEATLRLKKGDQAAIREVMDDLKQRRVTKQPLEFGSAGSTFKRPKGYFAGKLIEDAGLRGFRIGDAQVSEKHSGFVINKGNATAADVMELIRQVTAKVKEDTGVTMEPEVKRIGEF